MIINDILNVISSNSNNNNQPSNNTVSFDRRRFIGPESSHSFNDFPSIKGSIIKTKTLENHSSVQVRSEGRSNSEFRPIDIKLNPIFQANGSCYIEAGQTKIICAAYGPKPRAPSSSSSLTSSNSPLLISIRFTPFSLPGGRWNPINLSNLESSISQSLQQSLTPALLQTKKNFKGQLNDQYSLSPSSVIELHLTILEWDSPLSSIGHCVLAGSLSLTLARVPMIGLVIGLNVGISTKTENSKDLQELQNDYSRGSSDEVSSLSGSLMVDLTLEESNRASAILDLSYIPSMKSFTNFSLRRSSSSSSFSGTGIGIGTGREGLCNSRSNLSIGLIEFDEVLDRCKIKIEEIYEILIDKLRKETS